MKMYLSYELLPKIGNDELANDLIGTLTESYNDEEALYGNELVCSGFSPALLSNLNSLLEFFPNHEALLLRRSYYFEHNNRVFEAFTDLSTILNINPASKEALLPCLHLSPQLDKIKEVLTRFETFFKITPCFDWKIVAAAYKLYLKNNQIEEAFSHVNLLIDNKQLLDDPEYHEQYHLALYERSSIYYKKNSFAEAFADLNVLIDSLNNISDYRYFALVLRGTMYYELEEYDSALRDLTAAIVYGESHYINKDMASLHLMRSTIYQKKGAFMKELEDLNDVLEEIPDHTEALNRRAAIYCRLAMLDKYDADRSAKSPYKRPETLLETTHPYAFFTPEKSKAIFNARQNDKERAALFDISSTDLTIMLEQIKSSPLLQDKLEPTTRKRLFDELDEDTCNAAKI